MITKAQQTPAIDAQAVNQDLLVKPIECLPEQVIKNVETITNHQDRYQQNATISQRVLNKIAAIFGQSPFLYFQVVFFTIWGICSHLVNQHLLPQNFSLFGLQDQGLEAAALLISTGVLIYQTRQEELSAERSHLILQINLLTEQKITKLISLVEELRTDLLMLKIVTI
jgi:uncharacterized membrane protein